MIVGGVLSKTVMIWLHVAELPQTSVALYVLVNVKRLTHVMFEMTSPACVTVTTPPQLSEVVTVVVLTGGTRLAHCTVTFIGHVIIGALLSNTVMI